MTVSLAATVLWTHVAAGAIAVLAGSVALATDKGGQRHRRAGRWFVRAMAVVVGTVPVLLALEPTSFFRQFLTLVAAFSGYLAFSGYRVLARKRSPGDPARVDLAAAGAVTVACVGLGGWGVVLLGSGDRLGVVLVVFGALGVWFAGGDLRRFRSGVSAARDADDGSTWLGTHLSRMVAAFIATVSAVSVVNLSDVLGVASWLWPTVAFTPLIVYWRGKYADEGPLADRVGG